MGASRLSSDAVYLAALYLLPSVQRQGIGKGALQRLLAMDAYRDAPTLFVQAHERAEWAISFYERLGLRIIARGQEAIAGIEEGVLEPFALPEAVLLNGRVAETDLQ